MKYQLLSVFVILIFMYTGCDNSTEPEPVDKHGCLDSQACNYDPEATHDNNSCIYEEDCLGVCGGDAVEDCAGECSGNGVDADEDGVCDDVDECIGEYDECDVCNGNGEQNEC